jgi:hypothetical protein
MPIAMPSKGHIILRMHGPLAKVSGPSSGHIPLSWTQESREAAKRLLYRCGLIEFNHEHEVPDEQNPWFLPGYRLNAAHCLGEKNTKLQRILGKLGGEYKFSSRVSE